MDAGHISQEQADDYALGALEPADEHAVLLHIGDCRECRLLVHESERVAASLAFALPARKAPRGLKQRVMASAGIAKPSIVSRTFRLSRAAAGVAAVFVAVAAFTGMVSIRSQIGDLRDTNTDLQSQIDDARSHEVEILALTQRLNDDARTLFDLRQTSRADRELTLAILSPDSTVADVFPKEEAGTALGRLIWDDEQKKLWFVATRLPSLPNGDTYQIWMNSGGKWFSIGTFAPDSTGYARYETVLPQGLRSYDSALVTIERAGGSPERTGPSLFVADLSVFQR